MELIPWGSVTREEAVTERTVFSDYFETGPCSTASGGACSEQRAREEMREAPCLGSLLKFPFHPQAVLDLTSWGRGRASKGRGHPLWHLSFPSMLQT